MAKKALKLGELLLEAGLIDEIKLNAALSHQRNFGGRLGASLIKLGYITEEKILDFLSHQLRLDKFDFKKSKVSREAVSLLTTERARKYEVVPVAFSDTGGMRVMKVATTDPLNLIMIDELQFITGLRIEPVLVTEEMLRKAIDTCYPLRGKSNIDSLIQKEEPVQAEPISSVSSPDPSPQPAAQNMEDGDEEDSVFQSLLNDFVNSANPAEVRPLDQRFQMLIEILKERGILSIREFDQLKNNEIS